MNKFPRTIEILSQIQGLEGAVVFNFATSEILINIERTLNLIDAVDMLVSTIQQQQNLVRELELLDMVEQVLSTTDHHYHITYIVPQFDNVAIYLIVKRYIMLPYITQVVEDAVYAMH